MGGLLNQTTFTHGPSGTQVAAEPIIFASRSNFRHLTYGGASATLLVDVR